MTPSGVLPAVASAIQLLLERRRDFAQARGRGAAIALSAAARQAASALRRPGYLVIPGYYAPERCAALRAEIDRIMAGQPDVVQKDKFDADHRVFGAERASPAIAAFHDDAFLGEVGETYRGGGLVNYTTLAARLSARPGISARAKGGIATPSTSNTRRCSTSQMSGPRTARSSILRQPRRGNHSRSRVVIRRTGSLLRSWKRCRNAERL